MVAIERSNSVAWCLLLKLASLLRSDVSQLQMGSSLFATSAELKYYRLNEITHRNLFLKDSGGQKSGEV